MLHMENSSLRDGHFHPHTCTRALGWCIIIIDPFCNVRYFLLLSSFYIFHPLTALPSRPSSISGAAVWPDCFAKFIGMNFSPAKSQGTTYVYTLVQCIPPTPSTFYIYLSITHLLLLLIYFCIKLYSSSSDVIILVHTYRGNCAGRCLQND